MNGACPTQHSSLLASISRHHPVMRRRRKRRMTMRVMMKRRGRRRSMMKRMMIVPSSPLTSTSCHHHHQIKHLCKFLAWFLGLLNPVMDMVFKSVNKDHCDHSCDPAWRVPSNLLHWSHHRPKPHNHHTIEHWWFGKSTGGTWWLFFASFYQSISTS